MSDLDKLLAKWNQGLQGEFSFDPATVLALGDQIVLAHRIITELHRKARIGEHLRWVLLGETRPKHAQQCDIWVVDADGDGRRITDVEFDAEAMVFITTDEGDFDAFADLDVEDEVVTHWMPLPEPPKP
jgi:hypothetical protein